MRYCMGGTLCFSTFSSKEKFPVTHLKLQSFRGKILRRGCPQSPFLCPPPLNMELLGIEEGSWGTKSVLTSPCPLATLTPTFLKSHFFFYPVVQSRFFISFCLEENYEEQFLNTSQEQDAMRLVGVWDETHQGWYSISLISRSLWNKSGPAVFIDCMCFSGPRQFEGATGTATKCVILVLDLFQLGIHLVARNRKTNRVVSIEIVFFSHY